MLTISPVNNNVHFTGVPFALSKENRQIYNCIYDVLNSDKVMLTRNSKIKHSLKIDVYPRVSPEPIAHFEANDGTRVFPYLKDNKLFLKLRNLKEDFVTLMSFSKTPGNNVIAKVEEGEIKNREAENLFIKYGREFLEDISYETRLNASNAEMKLTVLNFHLNKNKLKDPK